MAKIYPNMGKEFCENPPYIANCKYCGAEAELGADILKLLDIQEVE